MPDKKTETSESVIEQDEFVLKRDEKKEELQSCQKKNGVSSCLQCEKVIGCEIRNAYVSAVYSSMNKGDVGGFDF